MAEKHQPSKPAPEAAARHPEPSRTRTGSLFSDARVCSNMGKGLRAVYMDLLRAPLPQKLTDILKKIDGGRK